MRYYGRIAETKVNWKFRFPETEHYLRKYVTDRTAEESEDTIAVSDQEYSDWESFGNTIDAFAEFCLLCEQTSEFLLLKDRCIIHAVALAMGGYSWLIAAGSGVGKSTLCRTLVEKYPQDIQVINGDKPALECAEKQRVIVHPSPWNGKEGWQGAQKAPLAGIFLLRRSDKTEIEAASESEAAVRLYLSIFQSFSDEAVIRASGKMTEALLKAVPVWNLLSNHPSNAAELIYCKMQEVQNHEL